MVDSMTVPGLATMVVSVSPALVGVAIALVAGVGWLVSGTAEELRRMAARDWDARTIVPPPARSERAAA